MKLRFILKSISSPSHIYNKKRQNNLLCMYIPSEGERDKFGHAFIEGRLSWYNDEEQKDNYRINNFSWVSIQIKKL